ncbi:MAG: pyrimidine/purine nucleoside phosphorylase [Gammaproteobacteria bacterium]|nr:pyrimidine/purine nucleoside phosphorylase [Gammaproteobacteria bacterium]
MSEFNNVTIVKIANLYFDGQVSSRTIRFADGSEKTLGVMLPGNYTFNTELMEIMEIQQGRLEVELPGSAQWQTIVAGESFEVPANAQFNLKVLEPTDYCCSYIK